MGQPLRPPDADLSAVAGSHSFYLSGRRATLENRSHAAHASASDISLGRTFLRLLLDGEATSGIAVNFSSVGPSDSKRGHIGDLRGEHSCRQ